jgi:AcrR family transcriptional regulator
VPKVSKEHSASQRTLILDSAVRCFAHRGFHRSTMRDVIQESGMSAGALYLYFKSKNELIAAIAESRHHREGEWINSALHHDDFRTALHVLLRSFATFLTAPEAEQERRLSVQMWSEALFDPAIHASIVAGVEMPAKMLTRFFRAAQRLGKLSPSVNCRVLARVLIGLYQGLLLQVVWEPGISLAPHLKTIDSMLQGLETRPGGPHA